MVRSDRVSCSFQLGTTLTVKQSSCDNPQDTLERVSLVMPLVIQEAPGSLEASLHPKVTLKKTLSIQCRKHRWHISSTHISVVLTVICRVTQILPDGADIGNQILLFQS